MRRVICALAVIDVGRRPRSQDDFDVLRGAEPVGPANSRTGAASTSAARSATATSILIFPKPRVRWCLSASANSRWKQKITCRRGPYSAQATIRRQPYGGFVGYNTQWQDLILSIEGDYYAGQRHHHGCRIADDPRQTSAGGNTYDVTVLGSASLHLTDYGSLRARAGWIFDNYFLPYGFVGVAIGRSDYTARPWSTGRKIREHPRWYPAIMLRPRAASISLISTAMGIRR